MFRTAAAALALAIAMPAATPAVAETVMVGGAPMLPTRSIVENAVNSADHTTLVAAVQAAGLADALASGGPFTVFAPVNAAFADLPEGTVETLLQPENKAALTGVLTYHVVADRLTWGDLRQLAEANGGAVELETLAGDMITVRTNGAVSLLIEDATGASADVAVFDVMQSNGVIHSIDKVLLPAG